MITNLTLFAMLMQFASIDGRVRDANTRKALPLVRVELSHQGVPSALEYTDAEGRFELKFIRPGQQQIQAGAGSTQLVELTAGDLIEEVELQAAPEQGRR